MATTIFPNMGFVTILVVGVLLLSVLVVRLLISSAFEIKADEISLPPCDYSAMYNFGDSNSDTGGIAAAFYPMGPPYGETYFGRPVGRASNGRLLVDFLADQLGIPYLSSYLDTIGSNYRHGVNFATGGASIIRQNESWFEHGVSPFPLEIQVAQYTQFKMRTTYFSQAKRKSIAKNLPKPEDFSKALYTLDIGQNDIAAGMRKLSFELQKAAAPNIVGQFLEQIRNLYKRGARNFWIHNIGPLGCLPVAVAYEVQDPAPGYYDDHGCVNVQNEVVIEFNKQLKDQIAKLRTELPDASVVYVDLYAAKYELITNAKDQGFDDPFTICCGYHGARSGIWCGNKGSVNDSEVFAGSCTNPSRVISWDGVHYSEAACQWIATRIVNGSYSDPPVAITSACHKQL